MKNKETTDDIEDVHKFICNIVNEVLDFSKKTIIIGASLYASSLFTANLIVSDEYHDYLHGNSDIYIVGKTQEKNDPRKKLDVHINYNHFYNPIKFTKENLRYFENNFQKPKKEIELPNYPLVPCG